jgi:hypothetical protein
VQPPRSWSGSEPRRYREDNEALATFAPSLAWQPDAQGWMGELPVWRFQRPEPAGLHELLPGGLVVAVCPPPVYPMVAPIVYPLNPDPPIAVRTHQRWHVAGDGRLCLMKTPGQWDPRQPVTSLLLRAIGWHVEYALMIRGLITEMTVHSIVDDDQHDALIAKAVTMPVLTLEELTAIKADD